MFTIDETSLPLQQDLAVGVPGAQEWVNDLPHPANVKFVGDYRAKYRRSPSFYGAQAYDAANLINSAVVAVAGDLSNKDGIRDAMRRADYASVRGPYRYGNNHFPIENFYLQEAVKNPDGSFALKTRATILEHSQDSFHEKCPMSGSRASPSTVMLLVIEQCLNGLQFGLLLFLLAAGLTLVFGIMDLINLAHGSLYMMGAYFAATFSAFTGSFVAGALLARCWQPGAGVRSRSWRCGGCTDATISTRSWRRSD